MANNWLETDSLCRRFAPLPLADQPARQWHWPVGKFCGKSWHSVEANEGVKLSEFCGK